MSENKEIAVFSDVHYSRSWDIIDSGLSTFEKRVEPLLNPNRELRRFIELMNHSPGIGMVINNGDSVDYQFADYLTLTGFFGSGSDRIRTTNLELFDSVMTTLRKPCLTVAGNHDYRREAYNYSIWGTDHINLPAARRRKYQYLIGHRQFRGPFELAALITNGKVIAQREKNGWYRKRDYYRIGPFDCLFLDSGRDAFAVPRNWMKCLEGLIRTGRISYDVDGFGPGDLSYVASMLRRGGQSNLIIFQHAPLINSRVSRLNATYRLSVDSFRRENIKQNISYNTVVNGGGRMLNILRHSRKNIVIICSHVHNAKYYLVHKESLSTREVDLQEFNAERKNPKLIKQLTTLPLGGIYRGVGGLKTGFLKISPDGFEEVVLRDFSVNENG